ncbi:ComEA family DNA-binding protein [Bordetella pertussis]
MNPFLHDPVARCANAPAWPLVGRGRPWRPRPPGAAARAPAGKAPVGRKPASEPLARWLVMAGCALAAAPAHALDVNTATVDQLETVRGVGPRTARVIIEERQREAASCRSKTCPSGSAASATRKCNPCRPPA